MVKAITALLLVGQVAHADTRVAVADPAVPEVPNPIDKTDPAPVDTTLHAMRDSDAASDRAFGRGTAIALDQGQFDFSIRTAADHGSMLSTAGGLGHGIELSFAAAYGRTLGTDYQIGAKIQLVDHEDFAFAIDTSINVMKEEGHDQTENIWTIDAKITKVTRNVVASASLGILKVPDSDVPPLPFVDGALILGSAPVRPMLEVFSFMGVFNMGFAGIRVGGKHVAFDLGVGAAGTSDSSSDGGVALMVGLGVRP
ncbi:MAG: hypothetical protein QM831_46355 [Kofleriaceae bacterium]